MKALKRMSAMFLAVAIIAVTLLVNVQTVEAGGVHTVTFLYGIKSYSVVVVDGGAAVPPTDTYVPGYNFIGWVGDCTNVTEDRVILGAYSAVNAPTCTPVATFTVKFIDGLTGEVFYKQEVSPYCSATQPNPPCHEGYTFIGYEGCYTNVTSDRTIVAKYVLTCSLAKLYPYYPYYLYYPYYYCPQVAPTPCQAKNPPLPSEVQAVVDHNTEVINGIINDSIETYNNVLNELLGQ